MDPMGMKVWHLTTATCHRATARLRHVYCPSRLSPGQWASARHQVPFSAVARGTRVALLGNSTLFPEMFIELNVSSCFIQCQVEWTWQVQKMNGVLIDLAVVLHEYPTWYPLVIKPSSGKSSIDYFLIFSHKILNFDCGFAVTFDFPPEGRRDRRWWGLPKHSVTPNPSVRQTHLYHFITFWDMGLSETRLPPNLVVYHLGMGQYL